MHICFVSSSFPRGDEAIFTFVKEYVDAIADKGVKCTVIAPQSLTRILMKRAKLRPKRWDYLTEKGSRVEVCQPYYITFSTHLKKYRVKHFGKAVEKTVKSLEDPVDVFYGHFWAAGIITSQIARGIPAFLACGESKIRLDQLFSRQEIELALNRISGVVYVSTKSLEEAKTLNIQRDLPYIIAPNGYNPDVFSQKDKRAVREKLGFPQDAFITAFVGSFIPRKGALRLAAALEELNKKYEICSVFIGKGKEAPRCSNMLFCGSLSHDKICDYLSAADAFVLPTNNEGCCNAIIEALACGLPVISSDKSFNDDILDQNCSIRLDEMDVSKIAAAIETLYKDKALTVSMSEGALKKAKQLTIGERSQKILDFITEVISEKQRI